MGRSRKGLFELTIYLPERLKPTLVAEAKAQKRPQASLVALWVEAKLREVQAMEAAKAAQVRVKDAEPMVLTPLQEPDPVKRQLKTQLAKDLRAIWHGGLDQLQLSELMRRIKATQDELRSLGEETA